jgi:hypothetical protein
MKPVLANKLKRLMKTINWKTLILFFILIPAGMFAQDEKSLWIDAKAGFNSVWLVNQNAYQNRELDYATTFGLTGGLGISYFLNDDWGVNTSPGYIKLGQNYNDKQSVGEVSRKVKLAYIQVPLLFMHKMPMTNDPTWIAFGPSLMFLTAASQEFKNSGEYPVNNPEGVITGDVKERYKPFDLALNFSVNKMYELRSSDNMMFLLSFDTSFGLLDINSKNWQMPNIHGDYSGTHNFYFGLKAGLMFNASYGK